MNEIINKSKDMNLYDDREALELHENACTLDEALP